MNFMLSQKCSHRKVSDVHILLNKCSFKGRNEVQIKEMHVLLYPPELNDEFHLVIN